MYTNLPKPISNMTPIFKTGTRIYRIHYSLMINGERHEKLYDIKGQNENIARKELAQKVNDAELEIHSVTRIK